MYESGGGTRVCVTPSLSLFARARVSIKAPLIFSGATYCVCRCATSPFYCRGRVFTEPGETAFAAPDDPFYRDPKRPFSLVLLASLSHRDNGFFAGSVQNLNRRKMVVKM